MLAGFDGENSFHSIYSIEKYKIAGSRSSVYLVRPSASDSISPQRKILDTTFIDDWYTELTNC